MRIKIKTKFKSLIAGKEVELPDFCVLTGKNGSGKSHFLESLTQQNYSTVFIDEQQISVDKIKYIAFNGLNPQINPNCTKDTINQIISNFWNFFMRIQRDANRQLQLPNEQKDSNMNNMWQNYGGDQKLNEAYKIAANNLSKRLNKNLCLLNEDDVRQNIDVADLTPKDTFSGEFATIFKSYYIAYDNNQYKIFQNKEHGHNYKVYTDDDFFNSFGPKPWDFVNQILSAANLPYEVNSPEGTDRDTTFHFVLRDPDKNIEIQPADLSTGEKVLMSLAMAIYNSAEKNIKNKILLIDEPDAALHPQFSKFLLETIKTYIVNEAGVKVIITTHSPTTVAMADEESIYEMNREEKIPLKVSKARALSILCEGIPSLRVSIDKQRIVFVESNYDAENYHKIFDLVKQNHSYDIQPVFHAANPHNGSNCDDVRDLLDKLNTTPGVYGIIDYDNHASSTDKIIVLGEGGESRYTIENYILDPIFIGLLLLRDNLSDNPIPVDCKYIDFKNATDEQYQNLITWVYTELGYSNELVTYTTISGKNFKISKDWIEKPGHNIETDIRNKWLKLGQITRGNAGDNALKKAVIDKVISDYPEYLSKDFIDLFNSLI